MRIPVYFIIALLMAAFLTSCSYLKPSFDYPYDDNSDESTSYDAIMADIQTSAFATLDAYNSGDYERARSELENVLQMLDLVDLQSTSEKLSFLDENFYEENRGSSFTMIAEEILASPKAEYATAQRAEFAGGGIRLPGSSLESNNTSSGDIPSQSLSPEGKQLIAESDGEASTASLFEEMQEESKTGTLQPPSKSTTYFQEELHRFIQKEIREVAIHMGEAKDFELPDDFVAEIEYYIRRFQNDSHYHEFFIRALGRSRKYIPSLREYFRERGFPDEIMYLAFIESGFNPVAVSRSQAVGMFQFMKSTGRSYGLKINRYVDERYSPGKSAVACREYLHDLLLELGNFTLALSSYNSGAGKTRAALRQLDDFRDRSFWSLREKTSVLHRETREFVPQIFAAIVMARPGNVSKFGFEEIPFPNESRYRTVTVPRQVSLSPLAEAAGITVEEILQLNPDLPANASKTPSKVLDYPLFVPRGTEKEINTLVQKMFEKQERTVADEGSGSKKYHRVQRGEALSTIARRYKVSVNDLKKWNGLRSNVIYAGTNLVVYPGESKSPQKAASSGLPVASSQNGNTREILVQQSISINEPFTYIVSTGNNLGIIADVFGVSVSQIKQWNGLTSNTIYVGQRLKIISRKNMKFYKYRVQSGDTMGNIALRFGARVDTIRIVNGKNSSLVRVGEVLSIFSI